MRSGDDNSNTRNCCLTIVETSYVKAWSCVHPWKVLVTAPAQSPRRSVAVEAVEVDLGAFLLLRSLRITKILLRSRPLRRSSSHLKFCTR